MINKICYNKEIMGQDLLKDTLIQYVENLVVDSIIKTQTAKNCFHGC